MRAAWFVWSVCAALVAADLVFVDMDASFIGNPALVVQGVMLCVTVLAFATLGIFIRRNQPNNRLAWVFLAGGTLGALQFAAVGYALWGLAEHAGQRSPAHYAGWFFNWVAYPSQFTLFGLTLFLFPNGRLGSPRWRAPLTLAAAATGLVTIATALVPGPLSRQVRDPMSAWTNPFGVEGLPSQVLSVGAAGAYPVVAASLALA